MTITVLLVKDIEDNIVAFDIADLLTLVDADASRLHWSVQNAWEPYSKVGDLGDLRSKIPGEFSWDELQVLSRAVYQTIWGTYLACRERSSLDLFIEDYLNRQSPEFYAETEIAFQAVDSTYWMVYARNASLLERVRKRFKDVSEIEVDRP